MATATEKLAALAVAVSTEAPLRLKSPGYQVYITHETIKRIRAVMDEAQIDWRQLHKNARARDEPKQPAQRSEPKQPAQRSEPKQCASARCPYDCGCGTL